MHTQYEEMREEAEFWMEQSAIPLTLKEQIKRLFVNLLTYVKLRW